MSVGVERLERLIAGRAEVPEGKTEIRRERVLRLHEEGAFDGRNAVAFQDRAFRADRRARVFCEGIAGQGACIFRPVQALADCIEIRRDGFRVVVCSRERIFR